MTFGRRLNNVENILQQDSAERAFKKLARTFAVQMEALKRYRTGGEQKVTVQHVVEKRGRSIGCDAHKIAQAGAGPADEPPLLTDSRGSAKPGLGDLAYEEQAWCEYVARQKTSP